MNWTNVLITDEFGVNALVDESVAAGVCAIDTETTGLFWALGHKAFLASFCASLDRAWVCKDPTLVAYLLDRLDSKGVKFLFHNAIFDLHMLRVWLGWEPFNGYEALWLEDTMHAFRILYPGQDAALKVASRQYFADDVDVDGPQKLVRAWFAEHTTLEKVAGKIVKKEPSWDQVPDEILLPYAAQDAMLTYGSHLGLQRDLLAAENPSRLLPGTPTLFDVYNDEMGVIKVVEEMERAGLPVDKEALKAGLWDGIENIEQLKAKWVETPYGDIKPTSHVALRKLFYDTLGEPVKHRTKPSKTSKEGLPSTSEAAQTDFETEGGKLCASILLPLRAWTKYQEKLQEFESYLGPDGRLHGSIRAERARTGRFSITEPALQNLARPNKEKAFTLARDVFRPGYGREFLLADFSQIELRLAAHFMNDEEMVHALTIGDDLHARAAARMYGLNSEQVTKAQRAIAKILNFSILYGAGLKRVTETLRYGAAGTDPLTPAEVRSALLLLTGSETGGLGEAAQDEALYTELAKRLLEAYHRENPKVRAFLDKAAKNAKKYKCIYTSFGLRIPIPEPTWSPIYGRWITYDHKAGNAVIQGTAAGLMKETIRRASKVCRKFCVDRGWKMWTDVKIILTIHDELIFDVPEGSALALARALDPVLSVWPQFNVPIKLEYAYVSSTSSWAFKEELMCEDKECEHYKTLADCGHIEYAEAA